MNLNTEKYKHVKWVKGGRKFPALDCFGLINEIRRDLNLLPWQDFAGITKDNNGLDVNARLMFKQLKQCEPEHGAGVACYSGTIVDHVAIVVNLNGLLFVAECNPKTNVTFLPLQRFIRRFHRVEFWK
ncbi:nitrite transporter [Snodgrassella alvi]|uniref:nitrite transporter n=1 Tax=Snodgrassella alvi TaxID=1196083 RepID=UPI0027414E13|nr:nitrite transporter [Snodgrassella alvi]WLT02909.1 nitrite transporter [Snodgrassella alvi]